MVARVDQVAMHERVCAVVVTVPGTADATAEALKAAVLELILRAVRASPDQRFDWSAAVLDDV